MKGKLKNQIAFYAENDDGLLDELIIDIVEKEYEYNGNLDKRELWEVKNPRAKEFFVEKNILDAIYDLIEGNYSGSRGWEDASYEIRQEEQKLRERQKRARTLVSKKKIWQAIKWELDEKELDDLLSYNRYRYEKSNYYDLELILEKIHAFMAGEKSVDYFTSWCILLMRCFYEAMSDKCQKRKAIYDEIADWFDGIAFMSRDISEVQKGIECRELIAYLKYYNHKIVDSHNGRETPFMKNGVVTYVTFAFSLNDGQDCMYRVCVADHERRTVNHLFVPNLDYNEEINYTVLTEGEFEELRGDYFMYELDTAMTEEYQLRKQKSAI